MGGGRTSMKIVFFGTPAWALPVLEFLHKKFRNYRGQSPIMAVVTQAPKPTGREQKLTYSAIDSWAYKKKIPVFYDSQKLMTEKLEPELGVISDYGQIISKEVIDIFPKGILNIHFSDLPKFRGASPVQAAIVSGNKEIGVTIFKIDEKLDHGPIISQFKDEINPKDTYGALKEKLFIRSADVLVELIPAYLTGKIKPRIQDENEATYCRLIKKEFGFIPPEYLNAALQGKSLKEKWEIPFVKNLSLKPSAEILERFIRAMDPWPNAWTYIQLSTTNKQQLTKKRLKILKAHLENEKLVLDKVQLEGKNVVSWEEFTRGYPEAKF
jgi:methionyl-tRNA formyltransferase